MRQAFAAVLYGLRYRPSVWLVCGLGWVVVGTFSAKIVPLIIYLTGDPSYRDQLLPALLPAALPGSLLGAYPLYGAIFMIVLGGLAIGNEYRWGTIGTLLVQGPSRAGLLGGQAAALAVVTLVTSLVYALVNSVTSVVLALALGLSAPPPAVLPMLAALGGSWLVAFVYAMIGGLVAHLFRSSLAAVVGAIVLVVAVENVVGLLANLLPALGYVQRLLPGPSSGVLAGALGAQSATPGVVTGASPLPALIVLLVWAAIGVLGSTAAVRSRDVAH